MKKIFCVETAMMWILICTTGAQTQFTADVYASYFGGSGGEYNSYIAADQEGNIILAGHTWSPENFPAENSFGGGDADAYIAKFNPDMTGLIFCKFLGGDDYDEIKDIGVDSLGNVYVTGLTLSQNFPFTVNACDTDYNGGSCDAFLTKYSPEGEMLYSTFIGGNNEDYGFNITVFNSSDIIITGSTGSDNFPVKSAYCDTIHNGEDVFLIKFNIESNDIVFSTYFGGNAKDSPKDIKTDQTGNIYICGFTGSSDFPVINTINSTFSGNHDGFIAKFGNNGEPIYSRLIGGTGYDGLAGIDISPNHEVYFTGASNSVGLHCSENAFYTLKNNSYDIILGKLNSTGDSLLYFSYYGGNNIENVIDNGGDNIYYSGKIYSYENENLIIIGSTLSTDFGFSENAYDKLILNSDGFVCVLNIERREVLYSSFLGGSSDEGLEDLWAYNDSVIFISGNTGSTNFPYSANAFRIYNQGAQDEIFARFKFTSISSSGMNDLNSSVIHLFPNPTSGQFTISSGSTTVQEAIVEVFNLLGNRLFSKKFQNTSSTVIDLTGYPAGMYLMKVTENEVCNEEKIIIKE